MSRRRGREGSSAPGTGKTKRRELAKRKLECFLVGQVSVNNSFEASKIDFLGLRKKRWYQSVLGRSGLVLCHNMQRTRLTGSRKIK